MYNSQEKLDRLTALSNLMTELRDTDVLLENILTEARLLSSCDAGSIYIRDEDMLIFKYAQNATKQRELPPGKKLVYSTFSMPISEGSIAGYVATHEVALNIPDVYKLDSDVPYTFNSDYDRTTSYRTGSMLSIPLHISSGKTVGLLQLINAMDEDGQVIPFKDDDIQVLKHFANIAAVALERAEITAPGTPDKMITSHTAKE